MTHAATTLGYLRVPVRVESGKSRSKSERPTILRPGTGNFLLGIAWTAAPNRWGALFTSKVAAFSTHKTYGLHKPYLQFARLLHASHDVYAGRQPTGIHREPDVRDGTGRMVGA